MKTYLYTIQRVSWALVLCVGLWGITACSDSKDGEEAYIRIIPAKQAIPAEDTAQFVRIESNVSWIVSVTFPDGTDEWCWVVEGEESGTGNASVAIGYLPNDTKSSRTATITATGGGVADDVVLTQVVSIAGGEDPDYDPDKLGWLELPQIVKNDNCVFVTHSFEHNGLPVRNYSAYYDMNERISYWVAYPLHGFYTNGTHSSSTWRYDPKVNSQYQANLAKGSYAGNSKPEKHERGHQIPNADRKITADANRQTYYSTNSTPQRSDFNGKAWVKLENWVRSKMSSDTLYVVTGAILKTAGGSETITYDADKDNPPLPVAVPNYYFKVLLQGYPANSTGTDYRAIGFWYPHETNDDAVSLKYARSVREIENMTGINFFANLPKDVQDKVETSLYPSDWGF